MRLNHLKLGSAAGTSGGMRAGMGRSAATIFQGMATTRRATALIKRLAKPGYELLLVIRVQLFPAAHAVAAVGNGNQITHVAGGLHLLLKARRLSIGHLRVFV